MFGNGPFGGLFPGNDFFANPFAHMDRVMGQMFNDPFLGPLGPAAGRQPHNQYQQNNRVSCTCRQPVRTSWNYRHVAINCTQFANAASATFRCQQQQRPIIEEVDDEDPAQQPAHDQPIVEEPDDGAFRGRGSACPLQHVRGPLAGRR